MTNFSKGFLWKKINNTRIIPVSLKIVLLFLVFIIVSNFTTNYINLIYNQSVQLKLMKQLLFKDLKDFYSFCNTQYEIYQFNKDIDSSFFNIRKKALSQLKTKKSIILCVNYASEVVIAVENGDILPDKYEKKEYVGQNEEQEDNDKIDNEETSQTNTERVLFDDQTRFAQLKEKFESDDKITEGFITFEYRDSDYFGFYKYNEKWNMFIIRAEELNQFYKESRLIFIKISGIIFIISLFSVILGVYLLRFILRFIKIMTDSIMDMLETQNLGLIDLTGAPNDDITFLGVAFNSLSSTINNLVTIFRKFANREVATKAYKEKTIKLEGSQKELSILFSDIKSFTYISETLGTDIIKLLNLHYDRAIREIIDHEGIIGSIIGDAILAVFGTSETSRHNKSYQAIIAAYKIQDVARKLRMEMHERKELIIQKYGKLSAMEKKIYNAVLLEVGVGVDGGVVFYGNIGSRERMTNTVIGDNVNAASRLEGLTRVYNIPVICSEYIKNDVEKNVKDSGLLFIEIDKVLVKGKTVGKKVYWPVLIELTDNKFMDSIENFNKGLKAYYKGEWRKANGFFTKSKLPVAKVFKERTKSLRKPKDWNGIWQMTTK